MNRERERMIVIGGGVGPMAGVALHRRIIEETAIGGSDQDHLEVIHLSRSPIIGDRSEYLAGRSEVNPAEGMLRAFRMAAAGLACESRSAAAGIPCNTFHAPRIFDPFREAVEAEGLPLTLVNMLEETAALLRSRFPEIKRIGVLSTTGTRESGVYETVLEPSGLEVHTVPADRQDELHEAIYHRRWGLKAVSPPSEEAVRRVREFGGLLTERGAEAVVLGCTELPLAVPEGSHGGVPYIDPMTALARALIRKAAPEKLREYTM